MAKMMSSISSNLKEFIEKQHLFFVATAGKDGRVNISPKGMDTLKVLSENRIVWLNLTGSGNETAAHLLDTNRLTLMWCSFDKMPLILRAYASAKTIQQHDPEWQELIGHFPDQSAPRQIFDLKIDTVQTSCGYGVPMMELVGTRGQLEKWADAKGPEGIVEYWKEKNLTSIDGKPTGLVIPE